ncbi:MAG: NUDIX hydrolase [Anaerolineaceae bacterium]|jgi:ADP-ribose pyrophosphatase|nr:NUDIX hydrolase [Anaerolineaceae bacterium]
MNFKILNRETVYKSRAFNIQKVALHLPDDRTTTYDLVDHNDSVTVVPFDQDGNLWFVRQYRLGAQQMLLELPAGVLDNKEPPEEGARREIREEIGQAAGQLTLLGDFYLAPGYANEHMYVFLATNLSHAPLDADDDEFLELEAIPAKKALQMAREGQFKDAKTVAALLMAEKYL